MAIAVYTAIAGEFPLKRTDITCFTGERIFTEPVMDAKRFKVLPHQYFPEHECSVWVDANIYPKQSAEALVQHYLGTHDFGLLAHPYRKTVWEEFATLRKDQRFQIPFLQRQLELQEAFYRKAGLPDDTPLYECNFMVRRHTAAMNRLMDAWWSELCRWQWRDQVSLPYVLWKYGADVSVRVMLGANIRSNQHFTYVRHH
jgi:hypothetical protein